MIGRIAATAFCYALAMGPGSAADWAGKQVAFTVGAPAGGGYDHLARLAARHLGRFLTGNPIIVVQNLPAGNSIAAANHIANVAARDGTSIALLQRNMLLAKLINPASVQFDVATLNWICSLNSETGVVLAWQSAPHRSAADLLTTELIVGGQTGVDPEISPRIYNALLGAKFRIVNGYQGTTAIGLAMERGEVQGIGDWSWSSVKVQRPQWFEQKQVRVLLQGALQRDKDLPDVPNALELVKNDLDRQAMQLYFTQKTVARPVVAPPGIPADRLADLRNAFMAMASDKAMLEEAEKSKIDIAVLAGQEVEKTIAIIANASPQVRDRLVKAMSPE